MQKIKQLKVLDLFLAGEVTKAFKQFCRKLPLRKGTHKIKLTLYDLRNNDQTKDV